MANDRLRPQTRALLGAFTLLTLLAVVSLVGGAAQTDRTFAWTIQPPATATFLGVGYLSGTVLVVGSWRSRSWARTRTPVLVIGVFTALTLAATVLHLDRFHLGAGGLAEGAAWAWLIVYVVVPLWIGVTLVRQGRPAAGRGRRLPNVLRVALAAEGAVLAVVGAVLYLVPAASASWWPWALTPLTARAVASWLLAYGLAAALLVGADRLDLLEVPALAYTVLGVGELAVGLAAAGAGTADLGSRAGVGYLVVGGTVVLTGAATALAARRAGTTPTPRRAGPRLTPRRAGPRLTPRRARTRP
ncbi:hypothetical protein V5H98_00665 [Georgenia sp. M64]|uniref:hypothetical protein n=1 Tax=Georgenia sp. M64 TaxID=3120520 RepID=UPI0030E5CA69